MQLYLWKNNQKEEEEQYIKFFLRKKIFTVDLK